MAETLTLEGAISGVLFTEGWLHAGDAADDLADAVRAWLLGQREVAWEAAVEVRDASPRVPDDADTYDVVDAVLAALTGGAS